MFEDSYRKKVKENFIVDDKQMNNVCKDNFESKTQSINFSKATLGVNRAKFSLLDCYRKVFEYSYRKKVKGNYIVDDKQANNVCEDNP